MESKPSTKPERCCLLGHLTDIENLSFFLLAWAGWLTGLTGALHCVGMCGPLISNCAGETKSMASYQVGRLFGYLFLALAGSMLGLGLSSLTQNPWISVIPGLLIGALFIIWGLRSLGGERIKFSLPAPLKALQQRGLSLAFKKFQGTPRSFLVGLLSIFLPCGLLYAVVLSALALNNLASTLTIVFFFWLGGVPVLMGAQSLIKKILTPLQEKRPLLTGISLMAIGLATLAFRLFQSFSQNPPNCH